MITKNEYIIHKEAELLDASKYVISNAGNRRIICLEGNLGSGKTAFVKATLAYLNSTDSVSSPSYSLVNEYHYPKGKVFHMDLYRLKSIDEALSIGIEEYLYSGEYCFIEWPELIQDILPQEMVFIKIEILEGDNRKLNISIL